MDDPKYNLTTNDWGNLLDLLSGYPIHLSLQQYDRVRSMWRDFLLFVESKSGKEIVKTQILITGAAATGKSVLSQHMSGEAFSEDWVKSEVASTTTEKQIANDKLIRIIPGQLEQRSYDSLLNALSEKTDLEGIIHVVDFGYNKIRNVGGLSKDVNQKKLIEQLGIDTITKLRNYNLRNEIQYIRTLVHQIKFAKKKPKWVLIAINKADLFIDELDIARKYYDHNDPTMFSSDLFPLLADEFDNELTFKSVIKDLSNYLGEGNVNINYLPVFTAHENYEFNADVVKSQVNDASHRNYMMRLFLENLKYISESS
jgi:archaellum biogenesis ATPase FlaH